MLALVYIDLDGFKAINDTYGHKAGDLVLVETTDILRKYSREYDLVARWGGEEMLIMLPNTDQETACKIAERIRKSIESHIYNYQEQEIRVTVSLGIASLIESGKETKGVNTYETILELADSALYSAKDQGRNQVVVYK